MSNTDPIRMVAPYGYVQNAVMSYLRKNPGLTAEQVSQATGLNHHGVRGAMARLADVGQLVRYRLSRTFVYAPATSSRSEKVSPVKEPEAANADIAELQAKLAELEAFKAEALERYPELEGESLERYRDVLAQFHRDSGNYLDAELLVDSNWPLDEEYVGTIKALINAAKAIAEIEEQGDADPA